MLKEIIFLFGIIFLISLLTYMIPQLLIRILPPLNLKKRYRDSWAFITGGSSGIGQAFALKLAKQGLSIVILGMNEDRLSSTESDLKKANPSVQVRTIKADLSSLDAGAVTQSILPQLEGLDLSVLFFNAGICLGERLSHPSSVSLKQFHANIVTHQHLFNALYPRVAARTENLSSKKRGAVLFTASCNAVYPMPFTSVYGATKAYLGQLGECLAMECADIGIDVVSLYPGPTVSLIGRQNPALAMNDKPGLLVLTADQCAGLALSAVGRFVRVDTGPMAVMLRLLMSRVVDANVFVWGLIKTGVIGKALEKMGGAEKLFPQEKE